LPTELAARFERCRLRSYAKLRSRTLQVSSDTNRRTDRRQPASPDSRPFRAFQNRLDPKLGPRAIQTP
jgi:hypothetical protein